MACGYSETCKCCCTNGCCPGQCWFNGLILTLLDSTGVCTTNFNLMWDPKEKITCSDFNPVIGCWVVTNVNVGTCAGINFRVACILDPFGSGKCVFLFQSDG